MKDKKNILVFINIIAPYNIPFFNRVSSLLKQDVLFVFDQDKEANRSWSIQHRSIKFNYRVENSLHIQRTARAANGASLHRTFYFPFFIFKRIREHKPSAVVSIEFGLRTFFCLLTCKLTGARLIVLSDVTPVTEAGVSRLKQLIRKLIARNVQGAIARSYTAKQYLKTVGIPEHRIAVSPYAIEANETGKAETDIKTWVMPKAVQEQLKDKFCLLYSGHFTHAKGLDLLIEAVNNLPQTCRSKLAVVLAGGTDAELQQIASYDSTIFHPLGFIPNEQILSLYTMANCFVLPTRSDTWALVVNEAVVAGCPVMVSKFAGSAGELIENDVSGLVIDPIDTKSFTEKLVFCITNQDRLLAYAQKAKEKLAEYNNDVSAKRFVDLLADTGALKRSTYN